MVRLLQERNHFKVGQIRSRIKNCINCFLSKIVSYFKIKRIRPYYMATWIWMCCEINDGNGKLKKQQKYLHC
jgi:hypothetical protein